MIMLIKPNRKTVKWSDRKTQNFLLFSNKFKLKYFEKENKIQLWGITKSHSWRS